MAELAGIAVELEAADHTDDAALDALAERARTVSTELEDFAHEVRSLRHNEENDDEQDDGEER